jgi:2-polyprenyl-3-methyl-5-hydroxy-6-metoxy-1,4-benzoquinol methylase
MIACPICASGNTEPFDDVQRCRACGHAFQHPPLITARYNADYVATYDRYPCELMSCLRVGFLKAFVARGRLLDVGYGNGAFIRAAEAAGFTAFGCDIHGVPSDVKEIDLDGDNSAWDVVTCFDSLEHFAAFSSIRSLMRRARYVLVSAPLPPATFPAERTWKHYKAGEHLHYFSAESLARLVGKPLLAESNVEDAIRRPNGVEQNIYTAIYH